MTKRMRDILSAKIQRTGKTTYTGYLTAAERKYLIEEIGVRSESYNGPGSQWFYFESKEPLNV